MRLLLDVTSTRCIIGTSSPSLYVNGIFRVITASTDGARSLALFLSVYQVENRLFRVPKYRLVSDSEHFASKYALDAGGDNASEQEYTTVENPQLNAVKLDDVSADDFQSFLKAVYPM